MAIFGQTNKVNGARRDTPSGKPRGRTIAQRVRAVMVPVRDAEPIGTAMMGSLAIASNTHSPMSNNNGQVSQNTGAGIVGRDARHTDALQGWQGAGARKNIVQATVGIQGGQSSQPAFPSTGTNAAPSIQNSLALMGLPQILRTPGNGGK